MKLARAFLGLLLCATMALPASATSAASPGSLDKQFETFLDWFPGRYDSAAQTSAYATDGTPEAEQNYRRHSIFRRVDLPAFGKVVFLAHQYRDGDTEKVYRQRLYTVRLDDAEPQFWLRVHVPREASALKDAYRHPEKLASLTPDDFTVWQGCDLYWRFEEARFVGRLEEGACRFDSEAFGQEIVLEETLTLSPDRISFADRGLSLSGDYLFGMRGEVPNISLKVRPFLCEWGDETVWLHDQGGTARLGAGKLLLERWLSESEEQTIGLSLSLIENGELQTRSFRQEDSDAINMVIEGRNMACRHAPETLYSEGGD